MPMNLKTRADRFALALERKPALLIALFLACYVILLIFPVQRRLWHDELFTYYISQAPNISKLLWESHHLDLNPPMVYAVTRGWQQLFGTNETVSRIPSAIAFGLASLGFVLFLRRRIGWLWAVAAILLCWASPNFVYATELRPYALLLFFFSMLLLSWDAAHSERHRYWGLLGVFLSACGMLLTHMLAIFPLGAVYLGELLQTVRHRRVDWQLWLCLLLPLGIVFTYFETNQTQRVQGSVYPPTFQAGPRKIAVYLAKVFLGIAIPACLAIGAAFLVARPRFRDSLRKATLADTGLWIGLLSLPFLINLVLMTTHSAFFERYCLATALTIAVSTVILLGAVTKWSRLAALSSTVVILLFALEKNLVRPFWLRTHTVVVAAADQIPAGLPVVAASGLAFLEMDHYERAEFLNRVYYLTDHDSALQYAHANIFEHMAIEAKYFPFRSHVSPYQEFIRAHPRFIVLGSIEYPEDWLLRKLVAEGAKVQQIGTIQGHLYRDDTLYEIDATPLLNR